MKVRMYYDDTFGWYESDVGQDLIELPDAVIIEWRLLKERLEEMEKYFDERIPPLQREADAKAPPFTPIEEQLSNRWAKLLLDYYLDHSNSYGCLIPKKDAAD